MKYIWYSFLVALISTMAEGCGCNHPDPADDPKNIVRPCPDFNLDCIRHYFANNSRCEVSKGPVPDPIIVDNYNFQFPHANMSMELYDIKVKGLNGIVSEFYINKVTNKLVLAVEMPCLRFSSPRIIFKYHRKARENVVRTDFGDAVYGGASVTATFPRTTDLDINEMEVFGYVEDADLIYAIGSDLHARLNPETYKQYRKFITNMPLNIQEKFVTQGPVFMGLFIRYNICNFGDVSTC